jgi:hypothetical protein
VTLTAPAPSDGAIVTLASEGNHHVLRYDGKTGAFQTVFVAAGSGGLLAPQGLVFAPPAALSGMAASAVSAHQVTLVWNDNSPSETALAIWRRTQPTRTTCGRLAAALPRTGATR